MGHTIEVKGIQCYAFHGCMPEEKKTGGKFLVDVLIHYNYEKAADTDDLKYTVDYSVIYQIVQQEMTIPSKLIETVAKRIAQACQARYPLSEKIQVKVSKLSPPIHGLVECISVVYEL